MKFKSSAFKVYNSQEQHSPKKQSFTLIIIKFLTIILIIHNQDYFYLPKQDLLGFHPMG